MKSDTNRSVSRSRFRVEPDLNDTSRGTPRAGKYTRPYWSANPRSRIRSVTFDIQEDEEQLTSGQLSNFRRMSAPELPPIQDTGARNSPTPNQGRYIKHRHKFKSDSSNRGSEVKTPQSPGSSGSSSGQKPSFYIGQRTVNGYLNRSKTWVVPEQTQTAPDESSLKLESIVNKKNGLNLVNTPRSNGYSSKLSSRFSTSSGNNNSNHIKKKLKHCSSDSTIQKNFKIAPIDQFTRSKTFIKRVSSDHQIKHQRDSSVNRNDYTNNRTLSIEKTSALTRQQKRMFSGNINGMRRYSSTLELTQKNSSYSDEHDQNDDLSDTESEKGNYILNWLIGVENEDAEVPPEPDIDYADEPPQTDTAVHVVYEES